MCVCLLSFAPTLSLNSRVWHLCRRRVDKPSIWDEFDAQGAVFAPCHAGFGIALVTLYLNLCGAVPFPSGKDFAL